MNIPDVNFPSMLVSYGPLGMMCLWFALRAETKIDRVIDRLDYLGHKINGMTRAMLAEIISRENHDSQARKIAEDMLRQNDEEANRAQRSKT
jgi:hypothetical protein